MTEYIIQYQPDTRDLHTRIYESILAAKSTSLSQLLTGNPGCPYTTLRTLKSGTVLPLLDFHVRRLLHGATALHPHTNHSPQPLRELLIALLRGILPHGTGCNDELQIVAVLVAQTQPISKTVCHVHVTCVPNPMQIASVQVECRGPPRLDPSVKNTSWYTQRKPLERLRHSCASETILLAIDSDGFHTLQEGLVTNIFFITRNMQIWTAAEETVLAGSMRECVLEACTKLKIQVVERAVRLEDYMDLDTAFLTNALKLLVPVSLMIVPKDVAVAGVPSEIHLDCSQAANELLINLRSTVCQLLESSAVPLFDSDTTL